MGKDENLRVRRLIGGVVGMRKGRHMKAEKQWCGGRTVGDRHGQKMW